MKKIIASAALMLISGFLVAQNTDGSWSGTYSTPLYYEHGLISIGYSDTLYIPLGRYNFIKVGDKVYKVELPNTIIQNWSGGVLRPAIELGPDGWAKPETINPISHP